MPRVGPIDRHDLIHYLRRLGFDPPEAGGRHQIMRKGVVKVVLPNPHEGDISAGLLRRILRDAGISREEWEAL